MGKLFGTDGVRGIANVDLTVHLAFKMGLALTGVLSPMENHKKPAILIGKDTRLSGGMLESAIAAGISASGGDAILAGVVPTPAVAFLVRECGFDAGVMISASHNSSEYNGIKIFNRDGYKLSDSAEEQIEAAIADGIEPLLAAYGKIGTVNSDPALAERYIEHIRAINSTAPTPKLRVVFDCSNGSASVTAQKIFGAGFAECKFLHTGFDGLNINENCGSTHMENLVETVKSGGYDIGIAFDGDADRCLAVDECGALIDGDMIICALGRSMAENRRLNKNTMVVTKLSNLGLHKFCAENNLTAVQTDVGDRYVLECMLEGGFDLGGEQSGHIIVSDLATTGDGQITAALILALMAENGGKASEIFGAMKRFPQLSVNVKVENSLKETVMSDPGVCAAVRRASAALRDNGRIILRPSGTEPLIRIMLEGEDSAQITALAADVENAVLKVIVNE